MTAFTAANDVLFGDPNLSVEAVYTPLNGAPVTVRAIRRTVSRESWQAFDGGVHLPSAQVDVRCSDVAAWDEGDAISFGGRNYIVRTGRPDVLDLIWTLDLDPA